jgi:lipopolysaccharide-induced tumor necrosis factor-alpha factor
MIPSAQVITIIHHGQMQPYLGAHSARLICQFCGADVMTDVQMKPGLQAHVWALGLCAFGCWPCCLLPYFVNECQAHVHSCPNCGNEVGQHGM